MIKYNFLVLWLYLNFSQAYRTDISESGEAQFCEYRAHLTFKPTATCCKNQVIVPGIKFMEFWDQCAQEVAGVSNTIALIGWDLYSCILKNSHGGRDEITLQEFFNLTTSNYPEDIRTEISKEIEKQDVPSASLSDYGKLEKIRVTYYDIEKEVCEGMPSETKEYGKIERCSAWKEENHRGGLCCKQAYPVDIRFRTHMDFEYRNEVMEACKMTIHNDLYKLNVSETMEGNLIEMCDLACYIYGSRFKEQVIDNTEYWKWDWKQAIESITLFPRIFGPVLKQQAMEYVLSVFMLNNTIEAMKNYEFADVIPGDSNTFRPVNSLAIVARGNKTFGDRFKLEFMRRRFHPYMIQIPVMCSAYREILTLMEYSLYRMENCQPDGPEPGQTNASSPPEEPSTSEEKPAADIPAGGNEDMETPARDDS